MSHIQDVSVCNKFNPDSTVAFEIVLLVCVANQPKCSQRQKLFIHFPQTTTHYTVNEKESEEKIQAEQFKISELENV